MSANEGCDEKITPRICASFDVGRCSSQRTAAGVLA